jgi:hypothetical protein
MKKKKTAISLKHMIPCKCLWNLGPNIPDFPSIHLLEVLSDHSLYGDDEFIGPETVILDRLIDCKLLDLTPKTMNYDKMYIIPSIQNHYFGYFSFELGPFNRHQLCDCHR